MKPVVALCAPALALTAVLSGCGGSSSPAAAPAASPSVSPAALATATATGCPRGVLPSGFSVDKAHTGPLTAHTYSASADVQAALEFDQLRTGARQVYLHRANGAKSAVDGVVSCVTLEFPAATSAARFFGSYRTLRRQAKPIVRQLRPQPAVKGLAGTTAYFEREQSFRGYGISSTNVIETAGQAGSTLYVVSVAGSAPSRQLATRLLRTMVSSA